MLSCNSCWAASTSQPVWQKCCEISHRSIEVDVLDFWKSSYYCPIYAASKKNQEIYHVQGENKNVPLLSQLRVSYLQGRLPLPVLEVILYGRITVMTCNFSAQWQSKINEKHAVQTENAALKRSILLLGYETLAGLVSTQQNVSF